MRNIIRRSARLALLVPLAVAPLAGCAATDYTTTTATDPVMNRTVLYPGGRYQLYGDGTAVPYHWVWIPTGGNIVNAPPLPQVPVSTVVTTTPIPAGGGQYQLYGNGTTTPFYWVWIPNGATPPPPPLPPRM